MEGSFLQALPLCCRCHVTCCFKLLLPCLLCHEGLCVPSGSQTLSHFSCIHQSFYQSDRKGARTPQRPESAVYATWCSQDTAATRATCLCYLPLLLCCVGAELQHVPAGGISASGAIIIFCTVARLAHISICLF